MSKARLLRDKREALFARGRTSEHLLFANTKQHVVALVFFGACQRLALRWRLRCFAEDATECRESSQGTCFRRLLGHTRRAACQCNGTLEVIDAETHLPSTLR